VPRRSSNVSPQRSLVWAAMILLGFFLYFSWMWLLNSNPWLLAALGAGLVCGVSFMLATGPRERRGTERFIIAPTGIARVAADFDPAAQRLDPIFIPWDPADAVFIERIGPLWKRLLIGKLNEGLFGRMKKVTLDAGFRCPDHEVEHIRAVIEEYKSQAPA